jgi:quercetin dioxygenase-like cupin family protein
MSEQARFNPNQITFNEGLERIRTAVERTGLPVREIVTSRDEKTRVAQDILKVVEVPGGFQKWQLPVYLDRSSQLFITVAEPNAEVPEHSHDEGDGIRFIASGSIIFRETELTAGDWMFIPARERYSLKVGRLGALMFYCYCCCCAGRTM